MSRRCCSIVRVASGGEARGVVGVSWGGWDGIGSGPPSLAAGGCAAPRTDLEAGEELGLGLAAGPSAGAVGWWF